MISPTRAGVIRIRPARAADQPAITELIGEAGINPLSLHWPRFLVADEGGRVVGVGQIKPHRDGSRELASLAVAPDRQGGGVGSALVQALQARGPAPLYLTCIDTLEGYYARFGFRRAAPGAMPPSLLRIYTIGNVMLAAIRRGRRLLVMVWEG